MSLINYLGAVASAAVEAATAAAIQQHNSGGTGSPLTATVTTSNVGSGGPGVNIGSACGKSGVGINRSDQGAPHSPHHSVQSPVVATQGSGGNTGAPSGRVAVPQGLSGFPVVPITIHHSNVPSGQFAYTVQAISNGAMRLAHPHGKFNSAIKILILIFLSIFVDVGQRFLSL